MAHHSDLFLELTRDKKLQSDALHQWINHFSTDTFPQSYQALVDVLREVNDAQFGIVSTLHNASNTWVRDATNAKLLNDRVSHDSPEIEVHNALLRCLSRLRPIDFAIRQLHHADRCDLADHLCEMIQAQFIQKMQEMLKVVFNEQLNTHEKNKAIQGLESQFNTQLIGILHEANLTQGSMTAKEAEKLLFHYRNLSVLLDPARTLVTLTYDERDVSPDNEDPQGVIVREVQYPVTVKTPIQKAEIQQLKQTMIYPLKSDKTAHTILSQACQQADALFVDLMAQDDRAFPAQARKTHLVGAKNAFIVKVDLFVGNPELISDDELLLNQPVNHDETLWLARAGSPVYVGKGESHARIQQHSIENIEQIRKAAMQRMLAEHSIAPAQQLDVHITTLNTNSSFENQNTIIQHVYEAARQNEDMVSYMPTNLEGLIHSLRVSPNLREALDGKVPKGKALFRKADRLENVAQVIQAAARIPHTLSLVHCASGQDRTGTAIELSIQQWMRNYYLRHDLNPRGIQASRARGGNAAEVASHLIPGSPGMKIESKADNLLGRKTFTSFATQALYRRSAATNKKNRVDDVSFLRVPSALMVKEYQQNLKILSDLLAQPEYQNRKREGMAVLNDVKAIGALKGNGLSSKKLLDLNWVLQTAIGSLRKPKDLQNIHQMAALSKKLTSQSSSSLWAHLGRSLVMLAAAALVILGVLGVIPSGGASIVIGVVLAASLSGKVASSLGFFGSSKEKALARSFNQLSSMTASSSEDIDLDSDDNIAPTSTASPK